MGSTPNFQDLIWMPIKPPGGTQLIYPGRGVAANRWKLEWWLGVKGERTRVPQGQNKLENPEAHAGRTGATESVFLLLPYYP